MNAKQQKVIGWIKSGMDYNEGVYLLIEITGDRQFKYLYGKEKSHPKKPAYELCKATQLADITTWKKFIADVMASDQVNPAINELTNDGSGDKLPEALPGEDGKEKICEGDITPGEELPCDVDAPIKPAIVPVETIATKPLEEYPLVMRRVILEYAELFQERSQLHTAMGRLPETNTDSVCTKRAELFDLIKSISDRLEILFVTQESFAKDGTIPNELELFPAAAEPVNEIPVNGMPVDEDMLKKQKKNLQSGNSKDLTILDYQANERSEVKNPMPKGPKRTKIELRIAGRNKRIEEIEVALLKF